MGGKTIIGVLFLIAVIALINIYYFIPFTEIEFIYKPLNYNFTLNGSGDMQFYPNMRFKSNSISYSIEDDCSLKKQNDMRRAFEIVENLTLLEFYEVDSNEEITITCNETTRFEGNMFIAGEGGPTKIFKAGNYNVILNGMVLLIRDSQCERPNIAIHELFHVLGFVHSNNKNNIMYNFTKCKQIISDDLVDSIEELYSYPSLPDLTFENVSAVMHKLYLDMEINVRNIGLMDSSETIIIIKGDGKVIKEVKLKELELGSGIVISLTNILVISRDLEQLELIIDYPYSELDKTNNNILLKIKK